MEPGLYIPSEILQLPDISASEKILLAKIHQFTTNKMLCYANNAFFAELLGIAPRTIIETMNRLTKKGYLVKEITTNEIQSRRVLHVNLSPKNIITRAEIAHNSAENGNVQVQIQHRGYAENNTTPVRISAVNGAENSIHNIELNNKLNNKEKEEIYLSEAGLRHTPMYPPDLFKSTSQASSAISPKTQKGRARPQASRRLPPTPLAVLVQPYRAQFGDPMVDHFLNYWTEKSPGAQRERWQLQKVFDPYKRLINWNNYEKKYERHSRHTDPERAVKNGSLYNAGQYRPGSL